MNYIDSEIINSICEGFNALPIRTKNVVGFIEYYKPETHVIVTTNWVFFVVRDQAWLRHDLDWCSQSIPVFFNHSRYHVFPLVYLQHITS